MKVKANTNSKAEKMVKKTKTNQVKEKPAAKDKNLKKNANPAGGDTAKLNADRPILNGKRSAEKGAPVKGKKAANTEPPAKKQKIVKKATKEEKPKNEGKVSTQNLRVLDENKINDIVFKRIPKVYDMVDIEKNKSSISEKIKSFENQEATKRKTLARKKLEGHLKYMEIMALIKRKTNNNEVKKYLAENAKKIAEIESRGTVGRNATKNLVRFKTLHVIAIREGLIKDDLPIKKPKTEEKSPRKEKTEGVKKNAPKKQIKAEVQSDDDEVDDEEVEEEEDSLDDEESDLEEEDESESEDEEIPQIALKQNTKRNVKGGNKGAGNVKKAGLVGNIKKASPGGNKKFAQKKKNK